MVCQTLKEFEKRWKRICQKVEKQKIERNIAMNIMDDFLNEIQVFCIKKNPDADESLLAMVEIANNLKISLDIAINHYEDAHKKSLWQKIFGDKPLNIDINAIKNKIGII